MAEASASAAVSLIEKVVGLLIDDFQYTFGDVDDMKRSLSRVQAWLNDAEAERAENSEAMKELTKQLLNVYLEIQDVLDEFMLHAPRHSLCNGVFKWIYKAGHNAKHWMELHFIQSKMQNIRNTIREIKQSPEFSELIGRHSTRPEAYDNRLNPEFLKDDEIIGMERIKSILESQLIGDHHWRLRTVSLVGPPGSGKTVLANNVFRSRKIRDEFQCFVWISVPPVANVDISPSLLVLFEIGKDERKIALTELNKQLRGKRYIVVVDDISVEKQWTVIKQELPDDSNYSRLIITTIDSQVAAAVAGSTDLIHRFDELGRDDSWILFYQKAFKSNNVECSHDLYVIGQKIIMRCGNLPQAIAEAGNLLSRKEPLPKIWEQVHDNLSSEINNISGNETLSDKLLRRYKDLPSNLKSCFLYFSIFPEGCCISRARLIRLWVAEGFVENKDETTLEEAAEEYLNELIARNLVHACSRDFDGRVRSCQVRYLVHGFAIKKSVEQNFAAVLTESSSVNSLEKLRRVSIHKSCSPRNDPKFFNLETIMGTAKLDYVRSLTAFGFHTDGSSKISVTADKFKLLKVLDLQGAPMQQFPASISKVTLLRYLSLRATKVREVPTTIHELHNLEYLDLKQTHVTVLAGGVFTLQKLRHLLVCSEPSAISNTFNNIIGADVRGSIGALHSLQKLTLVKANDKRFILELGHLEQLQKLGLVDLRYEDGKHLCRSIEKMKNLSVLSLRSVSDLEYLDLDHLKQLSCKLQCLYLKGPLRRVPCWINQSLSRVVRIKLELSRLDESPVEVLQALPSLIELQMVEAFRGHALIFETGSFQKLKTLHIERFYELKIFAMVDGAMPNLQKLTIVECTKLSALPDGMMYLRSLEKLHVYNMPQEFTCRLEQGIEDRNMISHIAEIKAFKISPNGLLESSKDYS